MRKFDTRPTVGDIFAVTEWTADHLQDIVDCHLTENLALDFKDGEWLDNPKVPDRAGELRRYVVGLANAEGGVLIIGIGERDDEGKRHEDEAWSIRPVKAFAPKNGLGAWVVSTLREGVYPALTPFPRVYEEGANGGKFLVIDVHRADASLVAVRCNNRQVFPARFGTSIVDLDEWAVRAILLGERQEPAVALGFRTRGTSQVQTGGTNEGTTPWIVERTITILNQGLVWVKGLRWGVVMPCQTCSLGGCLGLPLDLTSPRHEPVSDEILRRIVCLDLVDGVPHHVVPPSGFSDSLPPFCSSDINLRFTIPKEECGHTVACVFAVYVLGENMLPVWFSSLIVLGLYPEPHIVGAWYERAHPPIPIGMFHNEDAAEVQRRFEGPPTEAPSE
jgi:hypothetical protein